MYQHDEDISKIATLFFSKEQEECVFNQNDHYSHHSDEVISSSGVTASVLDSNRVLVSKVAEMPKGGRTFFLSPGAFFKNGESKETPENTNVADQLKRLVGWNKSPSRAATAVGAFIKGDECHLMFEFSRVPGRFYSVMENGNVILLVKRTPKYSPATFEVEILPKSRVTENAKKSYCELVSTFQDMRTQFHRKFSLAEKSGELMRLQGANDIYFSLKPFGYPTNWRDVYKSSSKNLKNPDFPGLPTMQQSEDDSSLPAIYMEKIETLDPQSLKEVAMENFDSGNKINYCAHDRMECVLLEIAKHLGFSVTLNAGSCPDHVSSLVKQIYSQLQGEKYFFCGCRHYTNFDTMSDNALKLQFAPEFAPDQSFYTRYILAAATFTAAFFGYRSSQA